MRLASWNIRGFGDDKKKSMIKSLIKEEKLDLIGLVETKHNTLTEWDMFRCWGHQGSEFMHIIAVNGSGGLILSWHKDIFMMQNSFARERWLCVEGKFFKAGSQCAICLVYAPSEHQNRLKVWDQLRGIRAFTAVPLILLGDFNEVLSPQERRGGKEMTQGMYELQNLFQDLLLIDMNIDQQYTWLRKNSASKIDRILVDEEIIQSFPNSKAYCKDRMFSDHFPLVLNADASSRNHTPFRSLDCWLDEPSFEKVFRAEWLQLQGKSLESKLKQIKKPLRVWNKDVFGHIDLKISRFQEAIRELDKEAQSRSLIESEWCRLDALRTQLWFWMLRKERYWRQLSRCKLIKEGDRNTKYFHLKATMRRQRNSIDKLIIDGAVITDHIRIKNHIVSYFKKLYQRHHKPYFELSDLELPKLSQEEARELEISVTIEEIREALFSCEPTKAPRYDGFNLKCIRKMWPILGEDFYTYIQTFFEEGKLHASFNTTWVVLIPKKSGVLEISDFRPISLVGSVYKIIAKVLSKRLRTVLPGLIGATQSAFVEGRQILDGALIANEVVHWLKQRKREGVLLKLDFQKAYDTIDWKALELILSAMGFGRKWIKWIKQCVSSASISILINGAPTKPFRMQRGLRQGDPLSPFLFLLVAEALNRMFMRAVDLQQLRGLKIGINEILISHLQFADDTLLFSEADQQQLIFIKKLLSSFQALTGLAVNYSKSALVVIGKDEAWATESAALLECVCVC